MYISATDKQAIKHLTAIKNRLERPELLADYPHIKPRKESTRQSLTNWSRERLVTASGAVVEAASVLGHMRGFKNELSARPDMMILDDIDADPGTESQDVVEKKLGILRTEILQAGGEDCVVLFAQNLIHANSICAQVMDHRADILSTRHFAGPFRLLRWYEPEKIHMGDGAREWKILAGEVSDPAIDLRYCERLLNRFGQEAFERECQQDVNRVGSDRDFRAWDERLHIITETEMVAGFKAAGQELQRDREGRVRIPDTWYWGMGLDWGTTRAHPAVFVGVTRPSESWPFSDSYFVMTEKAFPDYPGDLLATPEVVSPGQVARWIRRWIASRLSEKQIVSALMSHEASAARNTFMLDMPESDRVFFNKWKAVKGSGVVQIQNLLDLRPGRHAFRQVDGEALAGRPRLYFVVQDGEGELYRDLEGQVRVTGARGSEGFARARFEIPKYAYRELVGNKKLDDDFVDAFRGLMADFGITSGPMSDEEKIEAALPIGLRSKDRQNSVGWEMAHAQRRRQAEDQLARAGRSEFEQMWDHTA